MPKGYLKSSDMYPAVRAGGVSPWREEACIERGGQHLVDHHLADAAEVLAGSRPHVAVHALGVPAPTRQAESEGVLHQRRPGRSTCLKQRADMKQSNHSTSPVNWWAVQFAWNEGRARP
jgi:hypothetical protein